jgi:hypothetical protein
MKNVANGLARYGRNGDNNLVHVSDKELAGIEQLTGRKFTTNPHTGLPEAFNFASLLPVVAGVGGTLVGGPLGGAAAAGLTGAALGAAQGDSTERALTKGLIAGATTYAGGQLLSGVGEAAAAAGSAEAAGAAGQAAAQAAPTAGGAVTVQPLGEITASGASSAAGPATTIPAVAGSGIPSTPLAPGLQAPQAPMSFGDKLSAIGSNPEAAFDKLGSNITTGSGPLKAAITAGGTYAMTTGAFDAPKMPGETPYDPNRYPERFPTTPRRWNPPSSDYQPGYSPEYRYFAEGGLADLREGNQETTANLMNEAKAALLGEHPKPQEAIERFRNVMGDDAFMALKDRITGGRIKGAGGGLDDLVPGSIEGRQKVRLADSEFIIPADVVSAIGDGSTDHGARRLHEMMDGIRKQKTGSTKQPARLKAGSLVHEQ